jgi:hypothetical protein
MKKCPGGVMTAQASTPLAARTACTGFSVGATLPSNGISALCALLKRGRRKMVHRNIAMRTRFLNYLVALLCAGILNAGISYSSDVKASKKLFNDLYARMNDVIAKGDTKAYAVFLDERFEYVQLNNKVWKKSEVLESFNTISVRGPKVRSKIKSISAADGAVKVVVLNLEDGGSEQKTDLWELKEGTWLLTHSRIDELIYYNFNGKRVELKR